MGGWFWRVSAPDGRWLALGSGGSQPQALAEGLTALAEAARIPARV